MAYKVPVQDLMKSLQSAGAPFGNSQAMEGATPGLGQAIQSQVRGADTVGPQIKQKFMDQLAQVAHMDQKLGAVYADPTSPLYTDNVSAREKIISGAHSTNSQAAKTIAGRLESHQKGLDDQVNETVDLYKQLTAMQKREEANAEKAAKEEYRVSQGKGKYITDAKGNKVLVPVYKGKAAAKDATSRAEELKQKKMELAHLSDENAIAFFDNTPAKFQTFWISRLSEGENPPNGFNRNEVENQYNYWMKTFKPKTKSELGGGSDIPLFGSSSEDQATDEDLF